MKSSLPAMRSASAIEFDSSEVSRTTARVSTSRSAARAGEPLCPRPIATSLAGDQPSLNVVNTSDLALAVGSVPPEVVEIRFTSDSGNTTPSQFQCQMGPLGWTDPDRRVCAIALPPQDGGIFEYLDSAGGVLFEDGMAWFSAQGEPVVPTAVDPVHGGTYWAVYPWVGAPGSPEADDVSAQLLEEFGIEAFPGDLSCDDGAAEALGTDAPQGIGVYFETRADANAFARQYGRAQLRGRPADRPRHHVLPGLIELRLRGGRIAGWTSAPVGRAGSG